LCRKLTITIDILINLKLTLIVVFGVVVKMDPMSEFEENMKRKMELERKELAEAIVLNELMLTRDFNGKGR